MAQAGSLRAQSLSGSVLVPTTRVVGQNAANRPKLPARTRTVAPVYFARRIHAGIANTANRKPLYKGSSFSPEARRRTTRIASTSTTVEVPEPEPVQNMDSIHDALDAGLGSIVLVLATIVSLGLSNTSWGPAYMGLWEVHVGPAALGLNMSLHHWVNEAAMAFFFFVVGLEIKLEFVFGSLSSIRKAALPCLGALGGMVVPMAIFCACNLGVNGVLSGWAVPMATDIAFAMAVYGFFKKRMPAGVAAFLLTLATVDDLGAIAVIAVFFSHGLVPVYLGVAAAMTAGIYALYNYRKKQHAQETPTSRTKVRYFTLLGIGLWYSLLRGGINADIAGVVAAFAIPSNAMAPVGSQAPSHSDDPSARPTLIEHLIHQWSPWAALVVMPLFALANCAVAVDMSVVSSVFTHPVSHGIAAGLLLGKPLGIAGFSLAGIWLKVASWPTGMGLKHLLTVGMLGGIGFTMALFLIEQALTGPTAVVAKLSILMVSVSAALLGAGMLATFPKGGPYCDTKDETSCDTDALVPGFAASGKNLGDVINKKDD